VEQNQNKKQTLGDRSGCFEVFKPIFNWKNQGLGDDLSKDDTLQPDSLN